jgi:glycopeptide antibiotics resistance protein
LAGNVLVFAPLGLLVPMIWPQLRGIRRMALAGLVVSVSIELSQLTVSLAVGSGFV